MFVWYLRLLSDFRKEIKSTVTCYTVMVNVSQVKLCRCVFYAAVVFYSSAGIRFHWRWPQMQVYQIKVYIVFPAAWRVVREQ